MPTRATVINNALRLMGEPEATTLDSPKGYVKRVVNAWDDCASSWFEDHDWNFASTVTQLTQVSPAQPGWAYTFNLPARFFRLVKVRNDTDFEQNDINYEARGGNILADNDVVYMKYIDRDYYDSVGRWPQKFANALGAILANEVYPSTDESNSTRSRIEDQLKKRCADAKAFDARFDPVYTRPSGTFVSARSQGVRSARNGRHG